MNEYYYHPLPRKGDLIRITEVHSNGGNTTFKAGELVEVSSAYQENETGIVKFRAKAEGRKHKMLYSSKTYDWELVGREAETIIEAQEKVAEFVTKQSEQRFTEIWENWKRDKVFPEQVFENATIKRMFGLVFYSAFEDGWNSCVAHNFSKEMKTIELCIDELAKISKVNFKDQE